jgi:hypothetical protein
MDDRTAIAIQNAAQVVEGATHVDVRNIDVPVLMRMRRLYPTADLLQVRVRPQKPPIATNKVSFFSGANSGGLKSTAQEDLSARDPDLPDLRWF